MHPSAFNCPICGWVMLETGGQARWLGNFRGVYSSPEEGIVLTGVGLYSATHEGVYIASPDPTAHWDDPGYNRPSEHQFGVMGQGYRNGRHGFILHESCWALLRQAYRPAAVPHERLFEVLSSIPMAMTDRESMDWGHGYGGLVFLRGETSYFPWEYLRFWSRGTEGGFFGTPYVVDPLAASEVGRVLADCPQDPPSRNLPPSPSPPGHDPFNAIPEELRCAIAAHLPTRDFLNARLASRSFWAMFDTPHFWATRFSGADSERSWLYEAAKALKDPGGMRRHDWRWLYHRTAGARLGEGMKNRRRIWPLIRPVVDILDLSWSELPAELPGPWTAPFVPGAPSGPHWSEQDESGWVRASGNMWGHGCWRDTTPLQRGCTQLRTKRVAIPAEGIARIAASMVRLGRKVYVAGLRFSTVTGDVLSLGYARGADDRCLQLRGETLTGFNLAVGLGGIQALQCVSETSDGEHLSAWIGSPENSPKTRLLSTAASGGTMVLEFGFDGLKIVSIAAPRPPPPTQSKGNTLNANDLRTTALWYPEIPPPSLNLNTDFMVAPELYTEGYRPLFWGCFGGPGGIYLANLIKIRFILLLGRIDFSFNRPDVPAECRTFGQVCDWEHSGAERTDFDIDGPGGERIDRVEIHQELFREDHVGWRGRGGHVILLKIHTNRGRTCKVSSESKFRKQRIVKKKISASKGTIITGFYGAQYRYLEFDYTTLGVITEPTP